MTYTTLISTADLAKNLPNANWVIIDCRFDLAQPDAGRQTYQHNHIPGALYAHLDADLSDPIIAGQTSRHPLPAIDKLTETLSAWGIDAQTQVVAYDDKGGAIAARLWWLLRWMGHEAVAVLDGGWPRWERDNRPMKSGIETRTARQFVARPQNSLLVEMHAVQANLNQAEFQLFDSRAAARYRGEQEPLDPIAGHIPGAVSCPFAENLSEDGTFLSPDQLRARFKQQFGETKATEAVFYCGSGVTAAHNLLAVAHAGLGSARLYAGSWSEWITQADAPVAQGEA